MPPAPLPRDEEDRLAALNSYDILDSAPEEGFNDIVQLASLICETPIAVVSLVDRDRQWFKARVGLDATETPRELAFCAHTITNPDSFLVVPDATQDDRFSDNALVTGDPNIRLYAGAPLVNPEGHPLGTLCVIDRTARSLTEAQLKALRVLRDMAMLRLEQRRLQIQRADVARQLVEARDAAEEARKEAVRANESKSRFLANMSHELRTPLNSIIGYSEMLQVIACRDGNETYIQDLEKINSSGEHLLTLINDILDISKIEAGRVELHNESFGVEALLTDIEATARPLAEKNGNSLVLDLGAAPGVMTSDLTRVRQILFNLISNACKFTQDGRVTLRLAASPDDKQVIFEIEDTGIGMTEEEIGRLFQPFVQADSSTTRKFGGTGLGLAICRKLCELLEGQITVRSIKDQGSCFVVRLPRFPGGKLTSGQDDDPAARTARGAMTAAPGESVLLIDDDPHVRDIVSRHLEDEGYLVLLADNGKQGLELARTYQPAVITLDVMMPYMDGWAVLSELKKDPLVAHIPVVMLTMTPSRDLGFSLGAADFLMKPVRAEALKAAVERCFSNTFPASALIVEDDSATRSLLARLLADCGCQVREAHDGNMGLKAVAEAVPDIIILDLMMPECDGFEFVSMLRTNPEWNAIPVIIVTAKDLTDEERNILEGKVQQTLQKGGLDQKRLLREVSRVVRRCASGPPGDAH